MAPAFVTPGPRPSRRVLNAGETVDAEAMVDTQADALLPEGLLHDDEVVILLLRPSILFVPLSCATSLACIGLVTFLLAYLAPHLARWQIGVGFTDTHAFALGFLLCSLRLGWQALEWYSRVYVLTDRRIIRRMGVLRIAVFQTSLRNIQHTSVFTRVRERIFGLGTIGFATAGSDVFEAFWEMVRKPFIVHKQVVEAMRRNRGGRRD
jgi:hypothetical protein